METRTATMSQEQFKRQQNYSVSIYMANKFLDRKLIDKKEYKKFCKLMKEKYNPIFSYEHDLF